MIVYVCKNCSNSRSFIAQQEWDAAKKKTSIHVECGECGSTNLIETSSLSHCPQIKEAN